jgi:catalase
VGAVGPGAPAQLPHDGGLRRPHLPLVNEAGKARFVKWHWRPTLGTASLVWDETQKIAGKDPDFNRRDLWEAIEMGDYPEFELACR